MNEQFDLKVAEAKKAYTPAIIVAIAENKMPDCFEVTREGYVAMAQLLVQALNQIERAVNREDVKELIAALGATIEAADSYCEDEHGRPSRILDDERAVLAKYEQPVIARTQ